MRFIKNIRIISWLLICIALSLSSCSEEKEIAYVNLMKSEVLTDKALSESWGLMEQGQQLADNGKSIDEVLNLFPIGTILMANSNSIVFFIEGSVAMSIDFPNIHHKINDKGAFLGGFNKTSKLQVLPKLNISSIPINMSSFEDNKLVDVIGNKVNDNERQNKKALLLFPLHKELKDYKLGIKSANEYLKKNRNYKDNISFLKDSLTIEDFETFGDYDLVHLTTHGDSYCTIKKVMLTDKVTKKTIYSEQNIECIAYLSINIMHDINTNNLLLLNEIIEKYNGEIVIGLNKIKIRPEFLINKYKNGLENKIWIFSVCQLGINSNFANAMKKIHTNGHVFYWQNAVWIEDDFNALNKFYENLIFKGLDAKKSFEEIPLNLRENLTAENKYKFNDTIIKNKKVSNKLFHLQTGDPRHGIEVIDMLNPENKSLVQQGDFYPLAGDFNDGKDEALTLKVKLIGYTKAEFLEKQMSISLEVDDVSVLSKKRFLPDVKGDDITVKPIKDHEYGVIVTIKDIAIPDVGTKEKLTLKASLHLNNKKYSIHKEEVSIVANGIIATIKSSGAVGMKYIYDDKTKAVKANAMGNLLYYDDEGYTYMKTPFHGWQKMNAAELTTGYIQGKNEAQSWGLSIPMPSNTELNEIAKANTKLPAFIDFAINWRAKSFETSKEFNKTIIKYHSIEDCSKFIGPKGMTVVFSPAGKLLELSFGSKFKLEYEYGNYNVTLPKATKMDFMACMQHNH